VQQDNSYAQAALPSSAEWKVWKCVQRQVLTCTLNVPLSAVTRFNCLRISLFTAATCAPTRMGKVMDICPELMRRVGASALYDNGT